MFIYRPTGQLRRFPRTVRPYPAETLHSYLLRLTAANCCPRDEVIEWLRVPTPSQAKPVIDIERLAAATGHAPAALTLALPELANQTRPIPRFRHNRTPPGYLSQSRPACHMCVARRLGITNNVQHWVTMTSRICPRHRRWLGHSGAFQPDLDQAPEVLRAGRINHHLIRRRGPGAVDSATQQASWVVRRWCERRSYREHRDQRIVDLGELNQTIDWDNPALEAACYPDIVGLTSIFVSPERIERGLSAHPDHPDHLYAQIGRCIGYPDFVPQGGHDPIVTWLKGLPSGITIQQIDEFNRRRRL